MAALLPGEKWRELGDQIFWPDGNLSMTRDYSTSPSLAIDATGHPVVAWQEDHNGSQILVRRWDDHTWIDMGTLPGGASRSEFRAEAPALVFDHKGDAVVAWQEKTADYDDYIYVRWFDGHEWVGRDGSDSGEGIARTSTVGPPTMAVAAKRLCVSWIGLYDYSDGAMLICYDAR